MEDINLPYELGVAMATMQHLRDLLKARDIPIPPVLNASIDAQQERVKAIMLGTPLQHH